MAENKTEPAKPEPPAPPPKPKKTVAEQASAEIAKARSGANPARPLHYAWAFVKGTVNGALNGLAGKGRLGMKWGLAVGLFVAVGFPALELVAAGPIMATAAAALAPLLAMPAIGAIGVCLLGGFAVSAAFGAVHGLLTGGRSEMGREIRRDRYAEDLVKRADIRKTMPGASREAQRQNQRERAARSNIIGGYAFDYENRERQDLSRYWQDRETSRSGYGGPGR